MLELVGQLAYGSGLAHTIDSDNQNNIGLMVARKIPICKTILIILSKQSCDFVTKDGIQFGGRDILVACDTLLDAVNNLNGRIDTHIRGYQHFLQIIENLVVNFGFSGNGARNLLKDALLGFL